MNNKYLSLFIILTITFLASAIGGFTTSAFKEPWYSQLTLAPFNPPAWVFGPVWTTLYFMMAVAAWLIWKRGGWKQQRRPLIIFLTQLVLNSLWSPLFFGMHEPGWAFFNIVLLLISIIATIVKFFHESRTAALLLIPFVLYRMNLTRIWGLLLTALYLSYLQFITF